MCAAVDTAESCAGTLATQVNDCGDESLVDANGSAWAAMHNSVPDASTPVLARNNVCMAALVVVHC